LYGAFFATKMSQVSHKNTSANMLNLFKTKNLCMRLKDQTFVLNCSISCHSIDIQYDVVWLFSSGVNKMKSWL